MSERKKSLFLTKEMWAQDSPPLENSAWIFKDSNARKNSHGKNDEKIKIWFDENQNSIERKKWKTGIFTKFTKIDD